MLSQKSAPPMQRELTEEELEQKYMEEETVVDPPNRIDVCRSTHCADPYLLYTDGAARGNPGPAGCSGIILVPNTHSEPTAKEILSFCTLTSVLLPLKYAFLRLVV